jgi:hypothetical protein
MADGSLDPAALEALRTNWHARRSAVRCVAYLKALAEVYLGRKSGAVTALLKTLGGLPPDVRR